MFGIDGHVGETYADTFQRVGGITCIKGDNQRVLGWGRMRHWLSNDYMGRPWWTVDADLCPYTKRTIGSLVSDKGDPEDLDTTGEDHSGDAHRYGFMARPSPDATIVRATTPLTDSVKALLNTLQTPAGQPRPSGMVA